jgi:hypothetical protein
MNIFVSYPFIRLWGKEMGSFPYYINDQIARATEDRAPYNAIYRRDDGVWRTVDDIEGTDRQLAMYRKVFEMLSRGL